MPDVTREDMTGKTRLLNCDRQLSDYCCTSVSLSDFDHVMNHQIPPDGPGCSSLKCIHILQIYKPDGTNYF